MQKILITGGRAPAVLELIRILKQKGNQIYLAESLNFPLTRFSNCIHKNFKIASPRHSEKEFIDNLKIIIEKEKIDLLIPNCEEIFYIAKNRHEFKNCTVLCEDLNTLDLLHNKWKFFKFLQSNFEPQITPQTELITDKKQLNNNNFVFKPIYSRFAVETLIKPTLAELKKVQMHSWIKQEYIQGSEYSTYAWADQGTIKQYINYSSKYRAGQGAGIYFEYQDQENMKNFVQKIVKILNFTGHISFDYIQDCTGQIKILECNPRLTSGIHGLAHNSNNMLILPMFIYGVFKPSLLQKNYNHFVFFQDLFKAQEAIFSLKDFWPFWGQFLAFFELLVISYKQKISILQATTADIEWNG